MNRRRGGSLASNPLLIGAITTLVVIVATFLAYNANNGLPFVPSYDLNAQVGDAAGLIRGNDVRLGGHRIGVVTQITAIKQANGGVAALLHLKLDKGVEPLPVDSTILVRPRSPLGLKYVEFTRGRSPIALKPNSTIPLSQSGTPVQLDDFFNMFNTPTRLASTANLNEFGNAFAGRGEDLNAALNGLQPLVKHLEPVMLNLMDGRTGWVRFFPSLEQAAHEVVAVANQQGEVFVGLDHTFAALDAAKASIQASISGGPPSLDVATRELPAQAQFVADTTNLFHRFRPAFANLASASVQLAPAFAVGVPALLRAPALNNRLVGTLQALEAFAADARTVPGLDRLTETAALLDPALRYLVPAQNTCNYFALFFTNLASTFSESDLVGSFLRFGIIAVPQLPGSEAGPSATPANGPVGADYAKISDSFLHANPYPNTAAPGQGNECEAGSESYVAARAVIGNQPGNQNPKAIVEPTVRKVRP